MRILSAAGNLQGIRGELKLAESKPDSFWKAKPRARRDDQGLVSSFSHPRESYSLAARLGAHDSVLAPTQLSMQDLIELFISKHKHGLQITSRISKSTRRSKPFCDQEPIKVSLILNRALNFYPQPCVCRLDVASCQTSMNLRESSSLTLMPNMTLSTTTMVFRSLM